MDPLVAGLHTLCDAKMVDHAVDRGFLIVQTRLFVCTSITSLLI